MEDQLIHSDQTPIVYQQRGTIGRPTVITESVARKLEFAYRKGMSDRTACQYAKISREAYYNAMERDKDFNDRMSTAKNYLKLLAAGRLTRIIKAGADRDAAGLVKFTLERLEPETYGQRSADVQINQHFNYQPPQWFTPPQHVQAAGEIALSVVTSDETKIEDVAHSNALSMASM